VGGRGGGYQSDGLVLGLIRFGLVWSGSVQLMCFIRHTFVRHGFLQAFDRPGTLSVGAASSSVCSVQCAFNKHGTLSSGVNFRFCGVCSEHM